MSNAHLTQAADYALDSETRLRKLEEDVKKLQTKKKDGWEKLQAAGPIIGGVLVALVTYFLTGSVTNAIQRQQLQLSNVKEMRDLLAQLDMAEAGQADSAAFTLSAFGPPAVPALMAALVSGGEVRAPAAERALLQIGLSTPEPVCSSARRVIDSRGVRFTWLAHLAVIRLLGQLECRDARMAVEAYARALEPIRSDKDIVNFASRVDPELAVNLESINQLRDATKRTLELLRQ